MVLPGGRSTPYPDPDETGQTTQLGGSVIRTHHRRLATRAGAVLGGLAAAAAVVLIPAYAGAGTGTDTWNFKQARITDRAQTEGRDGRGVVVAVVDTWVDRYPTEFGTRIRRGADCLGGTCKPGPAHRDRCGHGTHVAGIVGSKTFGVAPKVTILPVRVLHYDKRRAECTGTTVDVAHGIRWATRHGAQVINLSLAPQSGGITITARVNNAVQDAIDAGVVVVFAAGNQGKAVADNYGGRALIVAATGPRGGLAPYSQRGKGVTVAAPGGWPGADPDAKCTRATCIASTWVEIKNGTLHREYAVLAGTSMAAPHISGIAALLIAEHPKRSVRSVIHAINSTARPLAGAGHGKVNAAAALAVRPPTAAATVTTTTTHVVRTHHHRVTAAATTQHQAARVGRATAEAKSQRQVVALIPRHSHGARIRLPARGAAAPVTEPLPSGPVGAALLLLAGYAATVVALGRREPRARAAT